MQQQLGELIRHLRRERSLTQTELGGEHYSKSYVSAVERDKIVPSKEALRFFAEQLDQSQDSFMLLLRESEYERQETMIVGQVDIEMMYMEVAALLDLLMEHVEQAATFPFSHLPPLSQEVVAALPREKQALYVLLSGVVSQQKQDHVAAQAAFEQALTLASPKQRPAIFDAIGVNYYQEQEHEAALTYHKRGLNVLEELAENSGTPTLPLKLHLHCANDHRALGAYRQACDHYEQARHFLNATHDMKTAAQLYLGLGYCTYAYMYQNSMPSDSAMHSLQILSNEEIERGFQRAVSFLVQSRTLYQVSGDMMGESAVRLIQAIVLLDLCKRRQHLLSAKEHTAAAINYTVYLDDAEEQCRQVLLLWRESPRSSTQPTQVVETLLYTTLAFRTRIFILRAAAARLGDYQSTAQRELVHASLLCQQLLLALTAPHLLWDLLYDDAYLQPNQAVQYPPSLLRIPPVAQLQQDVHTPLPFGKREVYFAAGEVMEERGSIATDASFAASCYQRADECFHVTLSAATKPQYIDMVTPEMLQDGGDSVRRYQRYIAILEDRLSTTPAVAANTIKTLLGVLKEGLILHQAVSVMS